MIRHLQHILNCRWSRVARCRRRPQLRRSRMSQARRLRGCRVVASRASAVHSLPPLALTARQAWPEAVEDIDADGVPVVDSVRLWRLDGRLATTRLTRIGLPPFG